jgi:transcriptional regulator with XRE-family HTH domain
MPKASTRRRHLLATAREILQLSQTELGLLVGAAQRTIQAIELQVRPLSERLAHRLSEETGIPAKQLLANELAPPLDPAAVRKQFAQAQRFKARHLVQRAPRMFLFRSYVVMRVIADELGYDGCRAIGFFDAVSKLEVKLLTAIPAKRLRGQLDQGVRAAMKASDAETLATVGGDVQEELQKLRNYKPPDATKGDALHKRKGARNRTSA